MAKRHRPVVLNADTVDSLLLTKLSSPPSNGPAFAQTGGSKPARPKPVQLTIFEEFVVALRDRVASGASKATVQQAAKELRDKAKFHKLTFTEIDAAISAVVKG